MYFRDPSLPAPSIAAASVSTRRSFGADEDEEHEKGGFGLARSDLAETAQPQTSGETDSSFGGVHVVDTAAEEE